MARSMPQGSPLCCATACSQRHVPQPLPLLLSRCCCAAAAAAAVATDGGAERLKVSFEARVIAASAGGSGEVPLVSSAPCAAFTRSPRLALPPQQQERQQSGSKGQQE
jgi:hypothetical protein